MYCISLLIIVFNVKFEEEEFIRSEWLDFFCVEVY